MLPDWLPWLLQVNDSQFPSGSYAHSLGLEELVQSGGICSAGDLEKFFQSMAVPALRAFDLPYLARAHRAAASEEAAVLAVLDHELDAWKLPAEIRGASRRIGSRRLAQLQRLAPAPLLEQYAAAGTPCHHLIVCALELREAPREAALCAYAYQSVCGSVYAAMKLLRFGQERAQSIVRTVLQALVPDLSARPAAPERIGWFNPLLEIASMRHARAAERLFIS